MTEVLKKGVVYRVLSSLNPLSWNRISFWTHADDVQFSDGTSASSKVGAITGISSDETANSTTTAASTALVHDLHNTYEVTIAVANWSSGTTTIADRAWYTCQKTVTKIVDEHPIWQGTSNTSYALPSKTEETCIGYISYVLADKSNNRLTFYATKKPTVALKILVKGVK